MVLQRLVLRIWGLYTALGVGLRIESGHVLNSEV